jgi:hypothetical protein
VCPNCNHSLSMLLSFWEDLHGKTLG